MLRPHPLVRVPRCLFRLLERGDGLHSDVQSLEYFFSWLICPQRESARTATQARLSACLCATASPSNPDPALRQTSPWKNGMIYSAQLSSSSTEIRELVKQRSFMVNHKPITAFLTYKASKEWPKGALNDALQFKNDLSSLDQTLYFVYRENERKRRKVKGPYHCFSIL